MGLESGAIFRSIQRSAWSSCQRYDAFSSRSTPHANYSQHRRDLLPLLSIFQPLGVIISTLLAYGYIPHFSCLNQYDGTPSCIGSSLTPPDCIPARNSAGPGQPYCDRWSNRGWRLLLITLGCISMGIFITRFFIFKFQESPKFLLHQGKDSRALHVIRYIGDFNKKPTNLSMEKFYELEQIEDSEVMHGTVRPTTRRHASDTSQVGTLKRLWLRFEARIRAAPNSKCLQHKRLKYFQETVAGVVNFLRKFKGLFSTWQKARLVTVVWLIYAFDFWGFSIVGEFSIAHRL